MHHKSFDWTITMTVHDLIMALNTMPKDAEITLDLDDGLDGNYMPLLGVTLRETVMGVFVTLDAKGYLT